MVSGVIVLVERPIKIGDLVTAQGVTGTVARITLRATTITTVDDAEVIIPNAKLIADQVVNYTHSSASGRVSLAISVDPDTNIEECLELLRTVVKSVQGFVKNPPPDCYFRGFSEKGLDFVMAGAIKDVSQKFGVENELFLAVAKELRAKNIRVSFPRRDVEVIQKNTVNA